MPKETRHPAESTIIPARLVSFHAFGTLSRESRARMIQHYDSRDFMNHENDMPAFMVFAAEPDFREQVEKQGIVMKASEVPGWFADFDDDMDSNLVEVLEFDVKTPSPGTACMSKQACDKFSKTVCDFIHSTVCNKLEEIGNCVTDRPKRANFVFKHKDTRGGMASAMQRWIVNYVQKNPKLHRATKFGQPLNPWIYRHEIYHAVWVSMAKEIGFLLDSTKMTMKRAEDFNKYKTAIGIAATKQFELINGHGWKLVEAELIPKELDPEFEEKRKKRQRVELMYGQ